MILSNRENGGKYYTEVIEWLGSLGCKTSDTALSRYAKQLMSSDKTFLKKTDRKAKLRKLFTEIADLFEMQEVAISILTRKKKG
jgi:hypothetical protein